MMAPVSAGRVSVTEEVKQPVQAFSKTRFGGRHLNSKTFVSVSRSVRCHARIVAVITQKGKTQRGVR